MAKQKQKDRDEALAKSQLKEFQEVEQRKMLPDQVHMWSTSPFRNLPAPPEDVKLFQALPKYGAVLGMLSASYLEAVSFPYFAHYLMLLRPFCLIYLL